MTTIRFAAALGVTAVAAAMGFTIATPHQATAAAVEQVCATTCTTADVQAAVDAVDEGGVVEFLGDYDATSIVNIFGSKSFTIEGNGHTLKAVGSWSINNSNNALFLVYSTGHQTFQNLTMDSNNIVRYTINQWQSGDTLVRNATLLNGTMYGMLVNGGRSEVDNVTTAGNRYSGVNLSKHPFQGTAYPTEFTVGTIVSYDETTYGTTVAGMVTAGTSFRQFITVDNAGLTTVHDPLGQFDILDQNIFGTHRHVYRMKNIVIDPQVVLTDISTRAWSIDKAILDTQLVDATTGETTVTYGVSVTEGASTQAQTLTGTVGFENSRITPSGAVTLDVALDGVACTVDQPFSTIGATSTETATFECALVGGVTPAAVSFTLTEGSQLDWAQSLTSADTAWSAQTSIVNDTVEITDSAYSFPDGWSLAWLGTRAAAEVQTYDVTLTDGECLTNTATLTGSDLSLDATTAEVCAPAAVPAVDDADDTDSTVEAAEDDELAPSGLEDSGVAVAAALMIVAGAALIRRHARA